MISFINRGGKKIAAEYYKKIEVLLLKKKKKKPNKYRNMSTKVKEQKLNTERKIQTK